MKKSVVFIVTAVILVVGAVCFALFGNTETSSNFFAMDTNVKVSVTGRDSSGTADKVKEEITHLDTDILSAKKESSEISVLNAGNGGTMSSDVQSYISTLLDVAEKSGGRYDFTLGALSDLWNFKSGNPSVPDDEEIKSLLSAAGYEKISISKNKISIPEGVQLDLGSAGKGIALDEIKKILENTKTKEAVISVGGSVLLYGSREFSVGISSPDDSGNAAELKIPACCVSTSGDYERYFEIDGVRYHHILDPETGYPADSGLRSVTIVSQSGILSDALSTACFVLGLEEGKKLAEEYDCEAVFITDDNRIIATGSLKDTITITEDGYTLSAS